MSNILDYIDWRGDLTFGVSPFCPVDNLIFSKLVYADLYGIVPASFDGSVTLREAFEEMNARGRGPSGAAGDPYPLCEKAAQSGRFGSLRLCGYERVFDGEKNVQFAAVTFLFDGGRYIAFAGTDDSFVGWREDAELAFREVTEGQKTAADYARRAGECFGDGFYLGGHSKGGNLAVYAAAFGLVPRLVRGVFSNDGPGLNAALAQSEEYAALREKVRKYIPESSIVGILLPDGCEKTVVVSDAKGIGQHNVYSWQVLGRDFVIADARSEVSVFADEAVQKWMDAMPAREREAALETIFDVLESAGCATFRELGEHKLESYNALLKAVVRTAPQQRREVLSALKKAARISGGVIWDGAKSRFEKSGAVQKIKGILPAKKDGEK